MKHAASDPNGFTLTEIMVATALFAIVVPYIFSAFMASSRQGQPQTQSVAAANIAKQIFERQNDLVRADLWNAWSINPGAAQTVNGKLYTPTANFTNVVAAGSPDYRKVTVNVNWDAAS
jgi:prepilin-type N-terminal cleavage/methylation domain-containing protein